MNHGTGKERQMEIYFKTSNDSRPYWIYLKKGMNKSSKIASEEKVAVFYFYSKTATFFSEV